MGFILAGDVRSQHRTAGNSLQLRSMLWCECL
jgi:hypothetical protein